MPKAKRKIITSHDGFQYLGKVYGIKLVPARGWVNDKEASADELARLVRQIRQDKVRAIFVENMNDPRVIERVAQETSAVIGGTLYSDALSKPGGEADTYRKMMRHNIETLKAGMTQTLPSLPTMPSPSPPSSSAKAYAATPSSILARRAPSGDFSPADDSVICKMTPAPSLGYILFGCRSEAGDTTWAAVTLLGEASLRCFASPG